MGTDGDYVEVWGDRVSLRDLVIALAACAVPTIGAVLLGHVIGGQLLFWGLGGAAVGFALACLLVTPKRDVRIVDDPGAD